MPCMETGRHLEMPAGRQECRPKSNPRRNLGRDGRATIPAFQSSPKSVPPPGGEIEEGGRGPSTQPKICRTLATVDAPSPISAGRIPAHQNAGGTGGAGCAEHAVKSAESVTRCECMPPKEKTRTYKGRGSGQGEGKIGTYAPRQVRWGNTPCPVPRKQNLMLRGTFSTPTQKTGKRRQEAITP